MEGDPLKQYLKATSEEKQLIKRTYQSIRYVSPTMTQLQVYGQKMPNLCGFHALSSAMLFDPHHPELLLDERLFAQNYFKLQQFLIDRIKDPLQVDELKRYGELHRHQLELIIKRYQQLKELVDRPIAEFNFGFGNECHYVGYLQNSEESLKYLEDCLARFKKGELSRIFILLGITVHWTLVVVENPSDPHLYYLDSINYPLKNILAEDYTGIVMEKDTLPYLRDLQQSLKILSDMVLRSVDLQLIKFENQLSEMLLSFAMVDQSSQNEVKKWFEDEYHPAVIRNDVIQPMQSCDLTKANPLLLKEFHRFLTVSERYGIFDVNDLLKSLSPYK